jgi:hypothetical protein
MLAALRHSFLILWLLAACTAPAAAAPSSDGADSEVVTEEHALPPFRQIVIGGYADVTLVQGNSESLTVEGARNQLRRFEVRVRDGTLTIHPNHSRHGWFSFFGLEARTARVTIAFRTLDRISADGAVKIRAESMRVDRLAVSASGATSLRIAELDAKALAVDGSGAIKMEVAGRTVAQTIEISGAGDYRAEDLASDTAKVAVSGAGRVVLRVAKTLDVDLSGAANVDYIGDPKVTRRVSGMGRIKQRDAMSEPHWTRNVAASGIDAGLNRSGAAEPSARSAYTPDNVRMSVTRQSRRSATSMPATSSARSCG